jgi:DNA-binding transcriptional ArsR family regulator
MGVFSHPAADRLLAELKSAFTGAVFDSRQTFFLFVCGGPVDGPELTLRRKFLDWSKCELPDFIVILAEEAFKQVRSHKPTRAVNLGAFEKLIAEVADIVVIFPESPGSYAEVGFFSGSQHIPAKTIVANDSTYRGVQSFLNLGPLRSIDSKSRFSPRIDIRIADPLDDFAAINRHLNAWKAVERRQRFTYAGYRDLDHKQRLIVILEMLNLLRLATLGDLRYAIKETFGSASWESVSRLLSILVGAEYVREVGGRYALAKGRGTMLEFEVANKKEDLIARVTEYYQSHRPELYDAVRTWASS